MHTYTHVSFVQASIATARLVSDCHVRFRPVASMRCKIVVGAEEQAS